MQWGGMTRLGLASAVGRSATNLLIRTVAITDAFAEKK
jgi:hypothetical protein